MKELKWYFGISLAIATSLLFLFSFPPYDLSFLGFIALVPVLYVIYSTDLKRSIGYAVLSGFLFYCLYLYWMNAYLAFVGVVFVTIVYGGYFAIALILINFACRTFPKYRVLLTPFIWVAIDYIRAFRFLRLTFGSIGYTQHTFLRFIQIADIGGEQLVSFLLVLLNAAVADLLLKRTEKSAPERESVFGSFFPLALSLFLIAISIVYGTVRLKEQIPMKPTMKISLIQALSSPRTKWAKEKWRTLKQLTDLSRESHRENPDIDLIVWTETAIRTSLRPNIIYGTPYHMRIQRLIRELKTFFIIGSPDNYVKRGEEQPNPENLSAIYPTKDREEVWTNSAYYLNDAGEITGKYDKMKLTPFGEHFPAGKAIPLLQKILDRFTDSAGFTVGDQYSVFLYNGLRFSVVICWEGTFGYFIRRFVQEGADFVINISNDMWTKTEAGHFQHFTITKFRAIENRIWYVRAGNDGVTAFINPYGEVVKILPIKETGYLIGEVGPRMRPTFYTRYGDILPKISIAVLIIAFVFSLFLSIKMRSKATGSQRRLRKR